MRGGYQGKIAPDPFLCFIACRVPDLNDFEVAENGVTAEPGFFSVPTLSVEGERTPLVVRLWNPPDE
jgi:hypothetical protein